MKNLNGCVGCLPSRSFNAFQKKLDPFFPDPFRSDALKEIVITLAVGLEIKTHHSFWGRWNKRSVSPGGCRQSSSVSGETRPASFSLCVHPATGLRESLE